MRHYQTVNGARRVAIPRCPCRKTHPPLGSGRLPYVSMMKATDPPRPPAVRPLRRAAAQEQASARGHHRPKRGGIASGGSTGSSALPSRPYRHILRRSEARSALARWISALDTATTVILCTAAVAAPGHVQEGHHRRRRWDNSYGRPPVGSSFGQRQVLT